MKRLAAILISWLWLASAALSQTFPDDWAGYVTHSVTTEPSSDLTDFTYFVSLDQMPSEFWTNVQTDGDDIRATSDAAGTTELPVDIIYFTDSGSTGSGLIAVKYSGTKASASDQPLYIWVGNGSATRPGDTDTYGRENAYASHWRAFWPSGAGTDRTSYDNDLTMTGSPTDGGVAGPINGSLATDYDGSTQYGTTTVSVSTAASPITFLASGRPDTATVTYASVGVADTAGADHCLSLQYAGAVASDPIRAFNRDYGVEVTASSATGFTASVYSRAIARFTAHNERAAAINGTFGTNNTVSRIPAGLDTYSVAARVRNTIDGHFDGRLSMVHIHTTNLSNAWIAYDAAVLADPDQSDFFGTWSWSSAGAPPTITTSATQTLQESTRLVCELTATGDTPITWTKTGGVDTAMFEIVDVGGGEMWLSVPNSVDFENPEDVGTNNVADVDLQAENSEGTDTISIAVTFTDEGGGGVVNPLRGGTVR